MKTILLLAATVCAAWVMIGCTNRPTANAGDDRRGLVDAGSVAPYSGGPDRPGGAPKRFQP